MPDKCETIIVGGGPAGLTAALALAEGGIETALVGLRPAPGDNRTSFLVDSSVAALKALGVWATCETEAAPLRVMRIVDDTGRLWRAPEVKFDAYEIDLEAFGYNIENRHLVAALEKRAADLPTLRLITDEVREVVPGEHDVTVSLKNGDELRAPLVVGADGRHSLCREAAGIEVTQRRYRQTALTVSFVHSHPHNDVATEFHTPSGPFTVVPLPGNRSSLVWVLEPREAEVMAALDDDELSDEIEYRSHSILGKIAVEPGRGLFPLSVVTAWRFAANRIALVGESAHVVPPIGAQGLNLGLRDAACIAEAAVAAKRHGLDIGGADVMARYDRMRRADIGSRTVAIDVLNRTLLTDLLPVQGVRGLALYAIDQIGPLRRALMREGIAPRMAQPKLMRGEAL